MSSKMNRHAYEGLIAEDLAWLDMQPRTLEREHIEVIVKRSADHEYRESSQPANESEALIWKAWPKPWRYDRSAGRLVSANGYAITGITPPWWATNEQMDALGEMLAKVGQEEG